MNRIVKVEDFEPYVGAETVERILGKAKPLRHLHIAHVNSTYYGGGVAEILSAKTLLLNSLGIKTGWRVIQGSPDFFSITKKMHNALQGGEIHLTDRAMGPFAPGGEVVLKSYYEVPEDIVEDDEELVSWARVAAALRGKRKAPVRRTLRHVR